MSPRKTQQGSTPAERDQAWLDLYRQAFALYGTRALWNLEQLEEPTPRDALVAAKRLRVEGNLAARALAERLERSARAHL